MKNTGNYDYNIYHLLNAAVGKHLTEITMLANVLIDTIKYIEPFDATFDNTKELEKIVTDISEELDAMRNKLFKRDYKELIPEEENIINKWAKELFGGDAE